MLSERGSQGCCVPLNFTAAPTGFMNSGAIRFSLAPGKYADINDKGDLNVHVLTWQTILFCEA